ncbi:energy-coupling factor transporter transmembrane protein EcfT [Gordonia sp. TBRC 11910]|uniref:Energy-coupling factor transporter transmembrane protein EcfT n=1 Tax=Gordonia asplenii TaxID=2725283 RepID=A0A848L4U6_9ACTN|nr:CbiQ family ECF transporter T component [Gordonia asplenii]NMO03623.1 energy-coupling factor transporter transmembrane protein EcfT [Gordonia asplenii]
MTAMGVYQPGHSVLHRLPVGVKLLGLASIIVFLSFWVTSVARLGVAAGVVVGVYLLGWIKPRIAVSQLIPVLWTIAVLFVLQVILTDWQRALVVCGVLLASVMLAVAVTLTTRTVDVLAWINRTLSPLRLIGVRTDQLALGFALAIRAIPLMVELVRQVEEARHARNLPLRSATMLTPLVISALRTADGFGETLIARGLD